MGNLVRYLRNQWDRVAAVVAVVGGVLLICLGWLGVARAVYAVEQVPYVISGGLGGLAVLAVGCTLWLSADLRDEWRKLDAIELAIRERDAISEWKPVRADELAPDAALPNGSSQPQPRRARATRTTAARPE